MIKTITHRNGVNVNKQLVSSFNEEIKRLNAEDYNYTAINTAFLQLEAYLKQLSARLGIDISISWSVSANGRAKLQLVNNNQRYNIQLRDLNQMFAGNFDAIAEFILQIETVYKTAANEFARVQSAYNTEINEYSDEMTELSNEYTDLLAEAEEADLTPEDIANIITEADDATKGELSQVEQTIEDNLPTPPEGTIGSGVTSGRSTDELISDAQKAAEEAAARNQELAEAEAGVKAAQEEANRAELILSQEEAYHSRAQEQLNQAEEAYQAAAQAAGQARNDLIAAETANNGLQDVSYSVDPNTRIGDIPAGVYPGEDGAVTSVTHHDGYTTISTVDPEDGAVTTRTYTDEDQTLQQALDKADEDFHTALQASAEAEAKANQAEQDLKTAQDNEKVAAETLADAKAEYEQAQAKVDAAQQAADDANIPYASDDELENGWYNDDAEPEDTTEGNDDWGDWDGPSWGDGSVDL